LVEASYGHEVEEVRSVQDASFVVVEACYRLDTCAAEVDLVFQTEEAEFDFVVVVVKVDIVAAGVAHFVAEDIVAVAEERSYFVVLDRNLVVGDLDYTEAVLNLHTGFRHLHKDCRHTDHNLVLCLDHNLARRSLADSCCSRVVEEDSLLARIHCNIGCFVAHVAWRGVDCMPFSTRYRVRTSGRSRGCYSCGHLLCHWYEATSRSGGIALYQVRTVKCCAAFDHEPMFLAGLFLACVEDSGGKLQLYAIEQALKMVVVVVVVVGVDGGLLCMKPHCLVRDVDDMQGPRVWGREAINELA